MPEINYPDWWFDAADCPWATQYEGDEDLPQTDYDDSSDYDTDYDFPL